MTARFRTLLLSGTALVALAVALAVAPGPRRAAEWVPGTEKNQAGGAAAPSAPAPDPERIRDLFRFGDEARPAADSAAAARPQAQDSALAPAPPGPRLVGLVWKQGRLVAALALDGEVELAGPGESAAGVTVVSAGQDSVVVRRTDGKETTLLLP